MEHRFCLDEILGKVSEMINDGYPRAMLAVLSPVMI